MVHHPEDLHQCHLLEEEVIREVISVPTEEVLCPIEVTLDQVVQMVLEDHHLVTTMFLHL